MSYVAAVEHLQSLGQELASTAGRRKFDLAHMRVLAAALGDPQKQFPAVLIAGTNGKGSTAATLASICAASGLRTGLYTSPHLTRVTERIRMAEAVQDFGDAAGSRALLEIPEEEFARLYFRVDETAQRLVARGDLPYSASFFETLTALAFLYFAEHKVEIAILEVGLGGRLDATNIVEPMLSIVTDIALDHQEYLGNTIAEIAREKAGILRAHGTVVTLPQDPAANQSIAAVAAELDTRMVFASPYLPGNGPAVDLDQMRSAAPLRANHYEIDMQGERLRVHSPLAGNHQQRNLALAIAAAQELRTMRHIGSNSSYNMTNTGLLCNDNSYNITNAAIEEGVAGTAWPGRLEFLTPNLLLDVAHNPAGALALRAALDCLPEKQPRTLIFSCLRDKDIGAMARILFPLFDTDAGRRHDHIMFTQIDNPRAAAIDALMQAARDMNLRTYAAHNAAEALSLARRLTPAGGLMVATGSIYLVGAVREAVLQP